MDDVLNHFIHLYEKEVESMPFSPLEIDAISEEEGEFLGVMPGQIDEEGTLLRKIEEGIGQLISGTTEFISYSSVWHGRVLSIQKDTVFACLTSDNEGEDKLFVEFMKNKLDEVQVEQLKPGALFSCSFGSKESESKEMVWKFVLQQRPKPSPEAMSSVVARMTAGLEHYYKNHK